MRVDPASGKEVLDYLFMCYAQEGGSLLFGFDLSRLTHLTLLTSPRALSFAPSETSIGKIMLTTEAAGMGCTGAMRLSLGGKDKVRKEGEEEEEEEGTRAGADGQINGQGEGKYTFEVGIARREGDSLHERPLLLRSGKLHNLVNWVSVLRRAAGLTSFEPASATFTVKVD